MIRPTAGHAELFGQRVTSGATSLWRRVGHLVESATAYPELSVRDNLDIARRLAGMTDRGAVDAVIERLSLETYADQRAGTLSLGNLQRLALARALLPAPELLVLDEPANGLDPAGVIEIRELIRSTRHRARRHRVHVEPHPRRGRSAGHTDRDRASRGAWWRSWTARRSDAIATGDSRSRRRDLDRAEAALRSAGLSPARSRPDVLELREPRALDAPDEVAVLLVAAGAPPTRLAVARESLEDHFMRLTGARPEQPS